MEAVFSRVLDMSITACWVIAAILLIRLLLKRAPKKYSYALWAVAAFRLICPVSIESAFSIFNLGRRLGSEPTGARIPDPVAGVNLPQTPAAPITSAPPTVIAPDVLPTATPDISFVTPTAAPVVPAEPESAVTLMGVLSVIWCAGIVLLLAYSVISYIRLRRSMSTSVLLDGNIRQAEDIPSPFILGFIRPQVYIPYHLSEGELGYVLAHERYHLRRGDHIVKPLAFLILALHWFNPIVWLAFYLMVKDMEMSCDEKVLSENEGIRKAYSSTLLSFAAGRAFPAPSPLSFGEGNVKSRIKNVLHWKKPALWISIAAIIICIAVILACATNPRESIALEDVDSVYAKGSAVSDKAAEELVVLLNSHRKSTYGSAPDSVGLTDSRVIINMADGSGYAVHHWYCSGFSFNPLHLGEDDYYTILSRLDAEGNAEKSWKMEYDFDAQFLSWLDEHSLANPYPFGSSFTLSEQIFKRDNGVTLPIETAETIRLENNMSLYAGDELPGTFEQWTITESGWDNYLTGSSGTWTAYNAAEMRRNNFRAWRSVNGDRMYCLLLQEDGTLYLAGGYYDAEGEYDSESDDSNIFCIYELTDKDSIRWHYIPYEHPDYFPLDFDFEYSSIHFLCTRGVVRYLDANGFINFNMDITLSEHDSELGWRPTGAMDMSVVNKSEMIFGRNDPPGEIYFTAELKNGETLSGTIVFSNPKEKDPDLYEATLIADGLCIKSAPEGEGAVIYREESDFGGVYAPVACVYIAPHSSYYPWGGDSGYRYIISGDSLTTENMATGEQETIAMAERSFRSFSTDSAEWTDMFILEAPAFEHSSEQLWLTVSDNCILLLLDGALHIVEKHDEFVWAIYRLIPEEQLGSAVWESRPEFSSRSPWFEFEFDMEYDNLQISTTSGDLSSDGSRVNGKQLGLPMGSTVRWSPLGRFQQSSCAQLQFTLNFADGGMIRGSIYISSEDNTLYTAALHANGLRLYNDEDYGHAVISLADSSVVIGGTDHAAIVADKLNETINMGGSYYLTPYIADYGKQETLLINHRNDISGFIRRCRLTPVEMPSTEPSEYWLEISGIIPGTTITVWQGSSDTVQLTTEEGSQYYRVDSGDLAASLMEFYSNNAPYTPKFTSDLDELLNKWQAEGVTELSAENLLLLNRNFVATITGEGNPLSNFFTCYYDRPEELNLAAFLQYNFISSAAYTEEDFYALKQQYPYHGQLWAADSYEEAVRLGNPIHKYPRELVDDQLMRYAGITTADLTPGLYDEHSGLVYLAESDAYFMFYSDMGGGSYTASSGKIDGDTAYLYSGFATLTLKKRGDVWLIVSHTYAEDAATTAYLANSVIEIFDVGGKMTVTEYSENGTEGASLTVTDKELAQRYSNILETFHFTKVDAPAQEPKVPRLEYTPSSPINRLIIWDSDTPLLRYSPGGHHEYYTFTSDVFDSLYDELYKSFDGQLQQLWLEERRVYTSDMNELLSKWQAEGVTTLSHEQTVLLNRNFIPMAWNEDGRGIASVNPLSSFFQCYYDRPEDIDLAEFLRYNVLEKAEVTLKDLTALKTDRAFIDAFSHVESLEDMPVPINKYLAEDVDALLMKYAGITTDDLTAEAKAGIIYLKEFDAYYNFTSDFYAGSFSCTSGQILGDTAYLYIGHVTLTLRKSGGSWLIVSHSFDREASLRESLSTTATGYYDQKGAFYLTLHTAGEARETITVSDRSVAEAIDAIMAEYTYTELEMPYTEPSEYWVVMEPIVRVNKMTFWSGGGNMIQYSPRGESSYYGAKTESGANLARALRRVYEEQLLHLESMDGFAAEDARSAAEAFTETVYGEHLMSLPAGGVYSIEDYNAVEHEIIEISEDGSSVRGKFTFAVWPEDYQKSGWWTDGIMGTVDIGAEYYGRILCTREYLLGFGKDGLWHCNALDPVE